MSEEKKLTDEKLISEFEHFVKHGLCREKITIADILNLIHRLQDDYSKLKERYVKVLDLNEKVIAEQKSEIERLTEAHERIAWSKKQYLDWVHGFLSTHTDMKDRGEKFEMFDRDWMCGVFWAKIEGSIEYIIDLEKQRNELQKQVDELKARNMSEMIDLFNNETDRLIEKAHQQAVKDTAKEILDEVSKHFGGKWLVELYKKYGLEWSVEVE